MALLAIRAKLLSASILAAASVWVVLALVVATRIEAIEVLLPNLRMDPIISLHLPCNILFCCFSRVLGSSTAILNGVIVGVLATTDDKENALQLP
jgi:hypothetical protein